MKYRVFIHGQNFLMKLEKKKAYQGFYITVYVEAGSAKDAEDAAIEVLRKDQRLREATLNSAENRPTMLVEDIQEMESFDGCCLPRNGLALYEA